MCINDGFGGSYYKNHLPKLGQDPESLVIPSSSNQVSNCTMDSGPFQIGDRVQVLLDMNSLRDAQIGHGGWSVKMNEVTLNWDCSEQGNYDIYRFQYKSS